jgi:hypothetical protein
MEKLKVERSENGNAENDEGQLNNAENDEGQLNNAENDEGQLNNAENENGQINSAENDDQIPNERTEHVEEVENPPKFKCRLVMGNFI